MPNRLLQEISPYLLQHANNPVDWYPWGEEALERARREDRPILLSIGYSACHWCHVMERESFEDEEIAHQMNNSFVCIKVDREERPDLDSIYMSAVQALTGHGGWPMTVFLLPDGRPFFGGTYFPPEDRPGMPGFKRVLTVMAQLYRERRGEVISSSTELVEHVRYSHFPSSDNSLHTLTSTLLDQAFRTLLPQFDHAHGGFGVAPKFPQPMNLEFLLRYYFRTAQGQALQMVEHTLNAMARGGIYDHLGGGFHRYSTDHQWLVPHFEKMLYDNALLARLYLHAYLVTGDVLYKQICEGTLDYVLREMTGPHGGFYSSQDADSEGDEGKYFVWSSDEIESLLDKEEASVFRAYYGVTDSGNFEGDNILNIARARETLARDINIPLTKLDEILERGCKILLEARDCRVPPGMDDKVVTAWNGLMLRTFAEAACSLNREDYKQAAIANGTFLLKELYKNGRLMRTYRQGKARHLGYLEDYSSLIDGLLALYEATFQRGWLDKARSLTDEMADLFWEDTDSSFYDTATDHEKLIMRPRDFFDNAVPCGSSIAVDVLLRMASFTGENKYSAMAHTALWSMAQLIQRHPGGFGHWLCALDYYISKPKEIAIIGDLTAVATQDLLQKVYGKFLPNRILAAMPSEGADLSDGIPLLQGRHAIEGRPTAYVCEGYACQMPAVSPEALDEQLSK
jgi:uncharacterized protein YyaL (SSP411 family)